MSVIYKTLVSAVDKVVPAKLQPLWSHPAGPKTIFFWAPAFKWGLVIAGIGDLARPADKISVPQQGALSATGLVWSRYSLVIIPKNWSLFSVNVFVAITGLYQLQRAVRYQRSLQTNEIENGVQTQTSSVQAQTSSVQAQTSSVQAQTSSVEAQTFPVKVQTSPV